MLITRRHAAITGGVLLAAIGMFWYATREPELTPEQQVAALIDGAVEEAEDGDVSDLMDRVSESYAGEAGDRQSLRAYLAGALLGGGIDVKVISRRITVGQDNATVQLEVALSRGGIGGALRGDAGMRTIQLAVRREGKDWKVTGATAE